MIQIKSILLLALAVLHAANGQNACTMCADVDLQEEEATQVPRMTGSDLTCDDLRSQIDALATTDEDAQCGDLQLTAYQIGCCRKPPFSHCTVCPDGTPLSPEQRNFRVPIAFGNDPTCAEAQFRDNLFLAPFEIGNCTDTFLRRGAHYCGCPNTTQVCTLCPDGSAPQRNDGIQAFAFNTACPGVEYIFSLFDEESCADVPLTYGFDAAGFCDCPNYESDNDYECSLCGEGKVAADREKIWQGDNGFEWSCGQAEDNAKFFNRESSCDRMLAGAREACGCVDSGASSVFNASGIFMSAVLAGMAVLGNLFF